ncbi:peptide deformylase, partial [candidate division KSB1 bacterium]|nr:peptide deformylase [candidate division KSB1 bacterium]
MDSISFKDKLNALEPAELKPVDITRSLDIIQQPSTDATMDEAEKIWPILEQTLDPSVGYGLAACQIGIHKKVAFIKYNGKEYRLLNTRIVDKNNEGFMYGEGCLSIPGKTVKTERYRNIVIEDDVLGRVAFDESTDGLLCTIIQHEVD